MSGQATGAIRNEAGQFVPGVSGNPNGRPKLLAEIEAEIRRTEGPHVLEVLQRMRSIALNAAPKDAVPAAKLYIERVMGPARTVEDPKATDEELEAAACAALGIDYGQLRVLRGGKE